MCQSELTEFFSQSLPSLPQNSVSSLLRNSTLETIFRPCPTSTEKYCKLGSEKGVFWKKGSPQQSRFLEILETLEILEILENPQTVENKGESDHFLENQEILEILEIPPVHFDQIVESPSHIREESST